MREGAHKVEQQSRAAQGICFRGAGICEGLVR